MEWLKQFVRLFGFKNAQVESLHEWNIPGYKVRVWRTQPSITEATLEECTDIDAILKTGRFELPNDILGALKKCKRIACVAIVDSAGNGVSYYPDWH